jgi:carbon storage regulator
MLILTRKIGQQVLIGGGSIQVKIIKADDDVITLGFVAPSNIDIDREEIFVRKERERMLDKKRFNA